MATSIDQSARLYPVRERVRLLNRLQCVNRHGQIAQVGAGGGGGQERQQQLPVVHMSSWGCGVNKRLCMQCGERSHSTSVVKAEPMGDKSKLYYCHACRCVIARAPMFTQHLKRHARCFVCPLPLCGLAKKTNDALLTHMFSHYGLKPYTCSICNKGQFRSGRLYTTLPTHTLLSLCLCTQSFGVLFIQIPLNKSLIIKSPDWLKNITTILQSY